MPIKHITRAAALLIEARQSGFKIDALPPDARPRNLAEAYAVQREIIAASPHALAGWKVGATSSEIQTLFGVTEPLYGPVFADAVYQSPCVVSVARSAHRFIECEFTFRFGRALPARAAAYARTEVLSAVEAVMPSFEIIDPRFAKLMVTDMPLLVADCTANGGAVLGAPVRNWQTLDFEAMAVALRMNGIERQRGTGRVVLGNPLNVLVWLANALSAAGHAIEAGHIVMTGTATGLHVAALGETVSAHFDGLGEVSLKFK